MHVRKVCEVIAPGPSTRSIREKMGLSLLVFGRHVGTLRLLSWRKGKGPCIPGSQITWYLSVHLPVVAQGCTY